MSDTSKPVWVWLPGCAEPIQCGTFTLVNGVGSFSYDADYLARPGALALDPMSLGMTRAKRPHKETRQGGLFGVFRDASPEGFGLALLERLSGIELTDPMKRLELSEGDSVGAVEVCDDIEAKCRFSAPTSDDLFEALGRLAPERPSSQAAREVKGLHGTSLGGERPKLTVAHKGQLWIAKLQDEGDAPHTPLREFVAMSLAAECGVTAAEVEFHCVGTREVVLVRRFDRDAAPDGRITRHLYASAHTVLRLDAETRGARSRSYLALAMDLQRWCATQEADASDLKRELWRRMAYNALCGNFDDHPRNHGLVHRAGRWGLAPAFDIAPYITASGVLAMAVTRDGSSLATAQNLVSSAPVFHYDPQEARAHLVRCRERLAHRWTEQVRALGFDAEAAPYKDPTWLGSMDPSIPVPGSRAGPRKR